jgi:hypothetical protein
MRDGPRYPKQDFIEILSAPIPHKIFEGLFFYACELSGFQNWRYFKLLNSSIFPGNDDFAGVVTEKVGYLGRRLTDFESKT